MPWWQPSLVGCLGATPCRELCLSCYCFWWPQLTASTALEWATETSWKECLEQHGWIWFSKATAAWLSCLRTSLPSMWRWWIWRRPTWQRSAVIAIWLPSAISLPKLRARPWERLTMTNVLTQLLCADKEWWTGAGATAADYLAKEALTHAPNLPALPRQ